MQWGKGQGKSPNPPCGVLLFRYGYSDAALVGDGSLAIAFQRTFDPPDHGIEGGGYDVGLALVQLQPLPTAGV